MLIALTIACAVSCLALVGAEVKRHAKLRVIAKLMASLAFVMIGLEALHVGAPHAAFAQWILVGLVLGAVGDAALLGKSNGAFLAGLVAFLGGHVAYVVAATRALPIDAWVGAGGPFLAIPIVAGALALAWLWPGLRTHASLRMPVMFYVGAIVTMVIAAIAVARGQALPSPQRHVFLVGAALFFASDLAVAREKFLAKTVINRVWGLPTYYAGQLLIAWALIGL